MVAVVPVNITRKTRNLGVAMDANITLSSHINDLCEKAFFFINSIDRIRKYLPPDSLKRLVNALVISQLDYCNSLLYGLPSDELAKSSEYRGLTDCGSSSIIPDNPPVN